MLSKYSLVKIGCFFSYLLFAVLFSSCKSSSQNDADLNNMDSAMDQIEVLSPTLTAINAAEDDSADQKTDSSKQTQQNSSGNHNPKDSVGNTSKPPVKTK